MMNTVKQDREELKRLVESYGKADVVKYVKHLNEDYAFTRMLDDEEYDKLSKGGNMKRNEISLLNYNQLFRPVAPKVDEVYYVFDSKGNYESTRDENELNSWIAKGKFPDTDVKGGNGPYSVGRKVWRKIAFIKKRITTTTVEFEDIDF